MANNPISGKKPTGRMSKAVELLQENMGSEGEHAALERETGRGCSSGVSLFHLLLALGRAFLFTSSFLSFHFSFIPKVTFRLRADV